MYENNVCFALWGEGSLWPNDFADFKIWIPSLAVVGKNFWSSQVFLPKDLPSANIHGGFLTLVKPAIYCRTTQGQGSQVSKIPIYRFGVKILSVRVHRLTKIEILKLPLNFFCCLRALKSVAGISGPSMSQSQTDSRI